jgi:BirA family biotin operon repressor/biotin-[acetyl-CoA-carboxylase] ligase
MAMMLQTRRVGHTIDYYQTVGSTMSLAHALAADPATRSGTLVVAEEQTMGLGRLHRHWEAPPAQAVLASLILKGAHLPANPALLPMMAGVAVVTGIAQALPELADEIGLKWPNDILLGDDLATGCKVGGVLIETSFISSHIDFAVVGMGINVNQSACDLPAVPPEAPAPTSLRLFMGRALDRTDLLISICQAWDELLGPAGAEHDIYHQWRNLLYTLGQPVTVHFTGSFGAPPLTGTAVDVTSDGELVILDAHGQPHVVDAGDVTTRLA